MFLYDISVLDYKTKVRTLDHGSITIGEIFEINNIDIDRLKNKHVRKKWFDVKTGIYIETINGYSQITKLYISGFSKGMLIMSETNKTIIGGKALLLLYKKNQWKRIRNLKINDTLLTKSFYLNREHIVNITPMEKHYLVGLEVKNDHMYITDDGFICRDTTAVRSVRSKS